MGRDAVAMPVAPNQARAKPARNEFEATLLEMLAREGPRSRADLARSVGITRATAGNVVARLLDEGIVRLGPNPGPDNARERTVGRPGELVALNPDFAHVIGVDAGIGFVLALRMDLAGEVKALERREIPLEDETPDALAELVVALIGEAARDAPPISGVSIAIPGIITRDGYVMRAPFLRWKDVPFRSLVADDLSAYGELTLVNDANALAMGEVIRGHVRPEDTNIFFSMDVGVGGSIIRDGALMDGQSGLAGEFGHIFIHPSFGGDAVRLEDLIGRHAVLQRHAALGGRARDLEALLAELDEGKAAAREVQKEWIDVMAHALSTITSVLNPGCIVFGGSMTAFLSRCMGELNTAYDSLLMHGTAKPRLILAESAEHSVARGCADLRRAAIFRP